MILGEFSSALYAQVASISGMLAIIICQIIAVHLGHQKPFPHAFISATAQHYPQFIFFRIGTISGSVFTILAHFTNYFWIKAISYESVFRIGKYYPKISLIFGIMGGLLLFVSTAAIDTGRRFDHLHVWCATSCFVFSILSCLYNTFICYILYSNTGKITKVSMYSKLAVCVAFFYQFWLMNQNQTLANFERNNDLGNDMDKILEYSLAFTTFIYIFLMSYDVKGFKYAYESKS